MDIITNHDPAAKIMLTGFRAMTPSEVFEAKGAVDRPKVCLALFEPGSQFAWCRRETHFADEMRPVLLDASCFICAL